MKTPLLWKRLTTALEITLIAGLYLLMLGTLALGVLPPPFVAASLAA